VQFLVKVRVNPDTMLEFGQKLQKGELDRSCIRGETYCLKSDPAVGYSIWETENTETFELKFNPWRRYYLEVEIKEVISPAESMKLLMSKTK
jgi:hypothetical protein